MIDFKYMELSRIQEWVPETHGQCHIYIHIYIYINICIYIYTRVSQKVMSPVNFNRFNLHIFSRNFKGV